jgi:hypothetical protein
MAIDKPPFQIYRGVRNQRGYGIGLGNAFGYLRKWIMPFFSKKVMELKRDAKPILEELGKSLVQGTSQLANDLIDGKKFKESSKRRLNEFENKINEISEKAGKMEGNGISSRVNTPIKRMKLSNKKSKRKRDIFDRK